MTRILTIIPALNAAARLPATLQSLAEAERAGIGGGWILADGGSSDATVRLARQAGCAIHSGARGRGAQLAAGGEAALARAAQGDWLLFLHADTMLEPGWSGRARAFMEANADRDRAGYFRFSLDEPGARARRLERMVAWRCKTFALPYGDQGLLIPAAFYARLGGYKPWPLFEDVDLVRRIGRRRLCALPARAVTSAERFVSEGYLKRSAKNLSLLARYYCGDSPERLARAYRK
ncbi:MAG: TIGR04283 family arsenosugar biosynthesis glycosyltransferase [Oceanicaulis sp.]